MKKIDTSFINNAASQPVKQGSLDHIQQSYQEILAALATSIVGPTYAVNSIYIINGCVNSGSGINYDISAGAIFYGGEVFLVPAVALTLTGSNVVIGTVTTTFVNAANADPVVFTDGSVHNIHQIRQIILSQGPAGSGIGQYTSFINVNLNLEGAGGSVVTGNFPNLIVTSPIITSTLLWIGTISGDGSTATIAGPTGTTITVTSSLISTDHYRLTHNIGSLKYYLIGSSLKTSAPLGYIGTTLNKSISSIDYIVSDDGSIGTGGGLALPFEIQIIGYI